MILYSEDGKTELGKVIGKKVIELKLDDGNTIHIIGNDYTILGQGKTQVSIVCEDGQINKEILPKKKEADNEEEEKKDDKKDDSKDGKGDGNKDGKSKSGGKGSEKSDDGSDDSDGKGKDDSNSESDDSTDKGDKEGSDDGETKRKYTRV